MSTADIAIKVQNLSTCYHIYDNPRDRLKQPMLVPKFRFTVIKLRNLYVWSKTALAVLKGNS